MAKDFAKAIEIATETEDAAKVAKDTVHGVKPKPVHKVGPRPSHKATETKPKTGKSACYRCGNENHQASQCHFKNSEFTFCGSKGHLAKVCRKKQSANARASKKPVNFIHEVKAVSEQSLAKLEVPLEIQGQTCKMENDGIFYSIVENDGMFGTISQNDAIFYSIIQNEDRF